MNLYVHFAIHHLFFERKKFEKLDSVFKAMTDVA